MFGFKLWGDFAVFREPLTITQTMTFPIPPKTTIGGILAAILGIDYNDYFSDEQFFDFNYTLILSKEIRKKSFAQNYIEDYTHKSAVKLGVMDKYGNNYSKFLDEIKIDEIRQKELMDTEKLTDKEKNELKKIKTKIENLQFINRFPKPKPIYRELLIEPEYLIFINNFKYEDKINHYLENHFSEYSLYMGNSEFSANYKHIACSYKRQKIDKVDSITTQTENIIFEAGKKYTNIYAATKTTNERKYVDYRNIVVSNEQISLKTKIDGFLLTTDLKEYNCEFI